jgi:hypothetical protein
LFPDHGEDRRRAETGARAVLGAGGVRGRRVQRTRHPTESRPGTLPVPVGPVALHRGQAPARGLPGARGAGPAQPAPLLREEARRSRPGGDPGGRQRNPRQARRARHRRPDHHGGGADRGAAGAGPLPPVHLLGYVSEPLVRTQLMDWTVAGRNKKLGLSGRKSRDVGILSTSKLYSLGDKIFAFTPQVRPNLFV